MMNTKVQMSIVRIKFLTQDVPGRQASMFLKKNYKDIRNWRLIAGWASRVLIMKPWLKKGGRAKSVVVRTMRRWRTRRGGRGWKR